MKMVKVIILNPYRDAARSLAEVLDGRGIASLVCETPQEARDVLQWHGESLDLAIVHREGNSGTSDPGMQFIQNLKSLDEEWKLPFIITTEKWRKHDCARHQEGPYGANAYSPYPFDPNELAELISSVVTSPATSSAPQEISDRVYQLDIPELNEILERAQGHFIAEIPTNSELISNASIQVLNEEEPAIQAIPLMADPETVDFATVDFATIDSAMAEPSMTSLENPVDSAYDRDVTILTSQLKSAHVQLQVYQQKLAEEMVQHEETRILQNHLQDRVAQLERERTVEHQTLEKTVEELQLTINQKQAENYELEQKLRQAHTDNEQIRLRVRTDLQKIRIRERELENRLEILRVD